MLGKNNATETISIKFFKKKMGNSTKNPPNISGI